MSAARDRILAKVRAALGRGPGAADPARRVLEAQLRDRPAGPRPRLEGDPVERFAARALALSSTVERVATAADAPAAIAAWLQRAGLPARAVVWPELAGLTWPAAGIDAQARKAHGTDAVGITGCFCAIAETGTLVLLSGSGTPGATSLLPETHVAIVEAARVVWTMEDAFARVRAERERLPRALSLVSGPSRTADIEQTIVLGAHGPYRVHIVLVGAPGLGAEAPAAG